MNILLIPATDWLRHPVPSRQHHVFELIAETDNVHVIQFDLYPNNPARKTRVSLHRLRDSPSKGLAQYYMFNGFFHWKQILDIIKSEKIDVVVVSNIVPGLAMLAGGFGCKVIVDLKDMFSDNSAIYYRNRTLSAVIGGSSEWLLRLLLRRADHVITVSMFLVNYLKEISIDNVSLIPNGVDLDIFKPNLHPGELMRELEPVLGKSKVVGFVGTVDRWIDLDPMLTILSNQSSMTDDVKLLVVGGRMVTEHYDEIRVQVAEMGLQDKVVFTGYVPHEKVPSYISLMDVCLIPMKEDLRLNQARCPDKLFEYLACGKPVVSTRISEVVRTGKNAVEFYKDSSSLATALANILHNNAVEDLMRTEALRIAASHSWRSIAKDYRETLRKVLMNVPMI